MRSFLLIVLAGLGSAGLGGGFGWLVGDLSPEFIALLAQPYPVAEPPQLGMALGLVSGLLLGSFAMGFGLLVDALRLWAVAVRGKTVKEPSTQAEPQAVPEMGSIATPAGALNLHIRRP
jgi:hypothetical protein